MNKLVVILGPTATGKTELAVKLCRKFNGEIISVDSRQAYQGMEIGTGKVTSDTGQLTTDQTKVVTHFHNLVEPNQQLNAYDYSQRAWEKIKEIWSRKKIPFLVGGSGFYLDVILGRRKLAGVGVNPELRTELESLAVNQLADRLRGLDPEKLKALDVKNKYRLIRAIEIALGPPQGHPLQTARGGLREIQGGTLIVGLTAENSCLYKRADERIDQMIGVGLVEEVGGLAKKYGWAAPGLRTLGYREFKPYFDGLIQLNEAVQKLKFNTHAYIRRQKTYFKKYFAHAVWFDISDKGFEKKVEKEVECFLEIRN